MAEEDKKTANDMRVESDIARGVDPMSRNHDSLAQQAEDIKERDEHLPAKARPKPAPKQRAPRRARRATKQRPAGTSAASDPAVAKQAPKGMMTRTWIVLEENDDIPPTGLFVSHNGNPFLLTTGEPIHVPDNIIELLDQAVTSSPQVDPSNRRVVGYRDRSRFPYRRVAAPKA